MPSLTCHIKVPKGQWSGLKPQVQIPAETKILGDFFLAVLAFGNIVTCCWQVPHGISRDAHKLARTHGY